MSKYEDALYTLLDIISEYRVEKYIISNKEIDDAIDSLEELINRDNSSSSRQRDRAYRSICNYLLQLSQM